MEASAETAQLHGQWAARDQPACRLRLAEAPQGSPPGGSQKQPYLPALKPFLWPTGVGRAERSSRLCPGSIPGGSAPTARGSSKNAHRQCAMVLTPLGCVTRPCGQWAWLTLLIKPCYGADTLLLTVDSSCPSGIQEESLRGWQRSTSQEDGRVAQMGPALPRHRTPIHSVPRPCPLLAVLGPRERLNLPCYSVNKPNGARCITWVSAHWANGIHGPVKFRKLRPPSLWSWMAARLRRSLGTWGPDE